MTTTEAQALITDRTIEAMARGFYKEAASYGFKQVDYVKFANVLLDLSMRQNGKGGESVISQTVRHRPARLMATLPLVGDRVKIRAFEKTDLDLVRRWLEDPHGRYFLLSRTTARSLDPEDLLTRDDSVVGVITLVDDKPIGLLAYLDVDRVQRKAELRKLIGEPAHRGKGLAHEATRLWIDYGLTSLGLRKIYVNTLDTNIRNIKLNRDLGFKVEGLLRDECYFDGRYHDIIRMALWADEIEGRSEEEQSGT